jgi:peptidoglycan/LPS O-acetylase OafA/YrhL
VARKLATLEAFRGVAATLVVFYHVQDIFGRRDGVAPFGGVFAAGDRGVDLFFVLSGFIIATAHARDIGRPGRVGPYLYRRARRLFPAVWIMTAAAAALYAADFGGATKAAKLDAWNVVASVLLLPQHGPALVNVTWTLTYEVFFYALFAALILSRRAGLTLLLAWQVAVALTAAGLLGHARGTAGLGGAAFWAAYYLRPICLEFGFGMACAWLATRLPAAPAAGRTGAWPLVLLLGAGTAVCVGGMLYEALGSPHGLDAVRWLVYGAGAGAVILALVGLERGFRLRVPGPLVALGEASYAIYLINFSILTLAAVALRRLGVIAPTDVMLLGCALLAMTAGGAFHVLLDKPIQALPRRPGAILADGLSWWRGVRPFGGQGAP